MNWAEFLNIFISIFISAAIGSLLIFLFMLMGERNALDERIFPTASESQRAIFGLIGFYLLCLTGLEILNPLDLDGFLGGKISFKPSFLGIDVFSGISLQDILSLILLIGLLGWFYLGTRRLTERVHPITEQKAAGGTLSLDEKVLKAETADLRFAFNFSAVSFLIALIAPSLKGSWVSNIAFSMVLGVFLISGIFCFIEAMELGARFASKNRSLLWRWVLVNVVARGIFLYLLIGIAGFLFYDVIPNLFADLSFIGLEELPKLVQATTKVVAGAFVILAAFLVAWGRGGLVSRISKFMVVVSLSPLIFPAYQIGLHAFNVTSISFEPFSSFAIIYCVILLFTPLAIYFWSASEGIKHTPKYRSVAFVRNISWAPFVAGKLPDGYEWDPKPFATAEELLEDVIGKTTRLTKKTLLPMSFWHKVAKRVGLHRDYDVIVIDLLNALRLKDGFVRQGRNIGQYFMVAGVCKRDNVCIKVKRDVERHVAVWGGPPYLRKNDSLHKHFKDYLLSKSKDLKINAMTYLPHNCVSDFFPSHSDIIVVPEPFATDIVSKLNRDGVSYACIAEDNKELEWLMTRYDVLLVRDIRERSLINSLIESLQRGISLLSKLKGPATFEDILAPTIADAIDPQTPRKLEAHSITRSIFNVRFENATVISYADARGMSNWGFVKTCFEKLRSANILEYLDESGLQDMCSWESAVKYAQEEKNAEYPLYLYMIHVEDSPGRLREILQRIKEETIDLRFLVAQRIGAGRGAGFIYLLPKDAKVFGNFPEIQSVIRGPIGFIPVLLDDNAGALEKMLEVFQQHNLNIDSCYAFSIATGKAVVLISLGGISQNAISKVVTTLSEQGYDTSGDFDRWYQKRA